MNLAQYDNSRYTPGRPAYIRVLWFAFGLPLLRASWNPFSGMRRLLLGLFGARVGQGVVIKPGTRIKYPWMLEVGDHSWIGEDAWIDNLAFIRIGNHVCLSQGVYLCTGNHDWSDPAFRLNIRPIIIQDGAWVGAKAIICPGVEIGAGAVATAGSVITKNLEPFTIYSGNPAHPVRSRNMRSVESIAY